MDDNVSITGRTVPRLAITPEDRSRLLAYVYPFARLPRAIRDGDWMLVAFCGIALVGLLLVHRYGQAGESRSLTQKLLFAGLVLAAAALVILADSSGRRLAGVALAPLPFLIDISIARRRVTP